MSSRDPLTAFIDGKPWPPSFTEEKLRAAMSMKPRPDDIFVCTYPKSGTTWVQHIVLQLLGKAAYEVGTDENDHSAVKDGTAQQTQIALADVSPMIEEVPPEDYEAFESPRVLKSHFTYKEVPKGSGAKYIYVCRNPKSCLNSYFYHHKIFKMYQYDGDFGEFFELFMKGQAHYGDYFDHLNSWLDGIEKGEEQILLLKYEDIIADLRGAVVEIATFLGGKAEEIVRNEEELARIVEASTLTSMKVNQNRWFPDTRRQGDFVRKGGSSDWKNLLSKKQSDRIDERFRQRCIGTVAADWWSIEMAWNDKKVSATSIDRSNNASVG